MLVFLGPVDEKVVNLNGFLAKMFVRLRTEFAQSDIVCLFNYGDGKIEDVTGQNQIVVVAPDSGPEFLVVGSQLIVLFADQAALFIAKVQVADNCYFHAVSRFPAGRLLAG